MRQVDKRTATGFDAPVTEDIGAVLDSPDSSDAHIFHDYAWNGQMVVSSSAVLAV